MLPVSTPAKAASLPLPKSKVNNFSAASISSSSNNFSLSQRINQTHRDASASSSNFKNYANNKHLGSPARDLTRQEKIDQRRIDGAQHKFATTYLRKPEVPVGYANSDHKIDENNIEIIGQAHIKNISPSRHTKSNTLGRKSLGRSTRKKKYWRPAGSTGVTISTGLSPSAKGNDEEENPALFSSSNKYRRNLKQTTSPERRDHHNKVVESPSSSASKAEFGTSPTKVDGTVPSSNMVAPTTSPSKDSLKNVNTNIPNTRDITGNAKLADLCEEDKMKVAKLIEQLMKLGAENEIAVAQFDQEKDILQENLSTAQEEAAALLKKTDSVQTKYAQSLDLIKGYQTRLRALAQERENAVSENRREKFERESANQRELELREEVESLRRKAERQRVEIKSFAELEKKQGDLVLKLRAKIVSRDAARIAKNRNNNAEPSFLSRSELEPQNRKQHYINDDIIESKIINSTPRTKKELGKVTTAVVSKLETELNEARLALNRLRKEQEKSELASRKQNDRNNTKDISSNAVESETTRSQEIPSKSISELERHVRIRDTPEMWDGMSMDDTNAPFTTLGYPQKANLEEADTVLSFHAEMDQREMPMPLPSKSLSPGRSSWRDKISLQKGVDATKSRDSAQNNKFYFNNNKSNKDRLNSLDVFEEDNNITHEGQQKQQRHNLKMQPMWGRTKNTQRKKHTKAKTQNKSKVKRTNKKKKDKMDNTYIRDQSLDDFDTILNENYNKQNDLSECFYEDSLFDLLDQMEELDESVTSTSLIEREKDFHREMKEGLQVSSSGHHFTGAGFVLAPAPEATVRRNYTQKSYTGKNSKKYTQAGRKSISSRNYRRDVEELDPEAWWNSVGSLLNSNSAPKKRVVKVMPAGGRNGDYWGTYTYPKKLSATQKQKNSRRLNDRTNILTSKNSHEINSQIKDENVEGKRQVKQK